MVILISGKCDLHFCIFLMVILVSGKCDLQFLDGDFEHRKIIAVLHFSGL